MLCHKFLLHLLSLHLPKMSSNIYRIIKYACTLWLCLLLPPKQLLALTQKGWNLHWPVATYCTNVRKTLSPKITPRGGVVGLTWLIFIRTTQDFENLATAWPSSLSVIYHKQPSVVSQLLTTPRNNLDVTKCCQHLTNHHHLLITLRLSVQLCVQRDEQLGVTALRWSVSVSCDLFSLNMAGPWVEMFIFQQVRIQRWAMGVQTPPPRKVCTNIDGSTFSLHSWACAAQECHCWCHEHHIHSDNYTWCNMCSRIHQNAPFWRRKYINFCGRGTDPNPTEEGIPAPRPHPHWHLWCLHSSAFGTQTSPNHISGYGSVFQYFLSSVTTLFHTHQVILESVA